MIPIKRKWFSTITNICYLVPAFFGDWFTRISLIALSISSALFHWHEHKKEFLGDQWKDTVGWKWQKGDMSSIYATYLFIMAYLIGGGLSWLFIPVFVLLALAEFKILNTDVIDPNHTLIGVLAFINCSIKITIAPVLGLIALGLFILAMVLETLIDNDFGHGLWHILTSAATTLLLI